MDIRNQKSGDEEFFTGVASADKYQSGNWIARKLVRNFMQTILSCVQKAESLEVHEIGCGEGHILGMLATNNFNVRGCDISPSSLETAARESVKWGLDIPLAIKSIYDLDPQTDAADTVLCCEVLEHLTNPGAGFEKLLSITRKDLIVSVPNEPIWHVLNMLRNKYWTALGNTPGHFHHWSKNEFVSFVGEHAEVVSVQTPLPWTVIHCRPHSKPC